MKKFVLWIALIISFVLNVAAFGSGKERETGESGKFLAFFIFGVILAAPGGYFSRYVLRYGFCKEDFLMEVFALLCFLAGIGLMIASLFSYNR